MRRLNLYSVTYLLLFVLTVLFNAFAIARAINYWFYKES